MCMCAYFVSESERERERERGEGGLGVREERRGRECICVTVYIMYVCVGEGMWHSMVDVALVYAVLWLLGGSRVSLTLTWLITMVSG